MHPDLPLLIFFSFSYFTQSRAFLSVAYLTVPNLARLEISIHCQVSVRSQYLAWLLSQCWIRWSHNLPTYRRTVTPNLYRTHSVPKFGLQSSWITGACHYTRLKPLLPCYNFQHTFLAHTQILVETLHFHIHTSSQLISPPSPSLFARYSLQSTNTSSWTQTLFAESHLHLFSNNFFQQFFPAMFNVALVR